MQRQETYQGARHCQWIVPLCGHKWNCCQQEKVMGRVNTKHYSDVNLKNILLSSENHHLCMVLSEKSYRWQRSGLVSNAAVYTVQPVSARTASRCWNKQETERVISNIQATVSGFSECRSFTRVRLWNERGFAVSDERGEPRTRPSQRRATLVSRCTPLVFFWWKRRIK